MYKRLKELRKKNSFTQEQVALFLKMSRTGYNQYEIGKNDIPTKALIKLSNLYNTSIDYILEVTDTTEPYEKNEDKKNIKEKIDFMRRNFRKNVKYSIYYENYFTKIHFYIKIQYIKKENILKCHKSSKNIALIYIKYINAIFLYIIKTSKYECFYEHFTIIVYSFLYYATLILRNYIYKKINTLLIYHLYPTLYFLSIIFLKIFVSFS